MDSGRGEPAFLAVKCPRCGKWSKAFAGDAGRRARCPHCQGRIVIAPGEGDPPAGELAAVNAAAPQNVRPELPDTTPPSATLALIALLAAWGLFQRGDAWFLGTALQPTWDLLKSCLWIGKAEVFLFLWGVLLLAAKAWLCHLQTRALARPVFPDAFAGGRRIGPDDAPACLEHLNRLARRPRRSILLNRVWLALDHLKQTRNVAEVRGALAGQSAIDANLLDSSYGLMRFLIWAVPILGFIGTVTGIGMAVSRFAQFIPKVSQIDQAMDSLRAGLGEVTAGLGAAFNTTLVALVLVVPLMLAASWLRTAEERLLAEIDQFTNHELLARLSDQTEEESERRSQAD